MNQTFKEISLDEFKNFIEAKRVNSKNEFVPSPWIRIDVDRTNELVWSRPITKDVDLRIYSSIPKNQSLARKKGEDAIRLNVYSKKQKRIIQSAPRTNRTTNCFDNLKEKATTEYQIAKSRKCPQCEDGVLFMRKNTKLNSHFVGCTSYPDCKYVERNKDKLIKLGFESSKIKVVFHSMNNK